MKIYNKTRLFISLLTKKNLQPNFPPPSAAHIPPPQCPKCVLTQISPLPHGPSLACLFSSPIPTACALALPNTFAPATAAACQPRSSLPGPGRPGLARAGQAWSRRRGSAATAGHGGPQPLSCLRVLCSGRTSAPHAQWPTVRGAHDTPVARQAVHEQLAAERREPTPTVDRAKPA